MKVSILTLFFLALSVSLVAQETPTKHTLLITPGVSYNGSGDFLLGSLSGSYLNRRNSFFSLLTRTMFAYGRRQSFGGYSSTPAFDTNNVIGLEAGLIYTPFPKHVGWFSLQTGLSAVHSSYSSDHNSNDEGTENSIGYFTGLNFRLINKSRFESGLNLRFQLQGNGDLIHTLGFYFGVSF